MDIRRLGLDDENEDDEAPELKEWREAQLASDIEHQKLGGPDHSRERLKFYYVDYARDDRGSRIPLAEEDDDAATD